MAQEGGTTLRLGGLRLPEDGVTCIKAGVV